MNLSAVPGFDGAVYLNGFPASKSKKGMGQNQVTNLVLPTPFLSFFAEQGKRCFLETRRG